MDNSNLSLDTNDLDKLNDKDKTELRQFLQNENQKARIQSTVHSLADVCFKKCITGTIKNSKLDKTEESCMANCAERFFDVSSLTMKQLQNMRQS
ncbi:Tim10/DDP family zinc finger protein [Xylaria longipes]|nr:Tim10/DDP family zinc finger protein [Xylaria longipes]